MNYNKFERVKISLNTTILEAMKQMDEIKSKLLLVVNNEGEFYSLLSIGDIQRALISNISLSNQIDSIIRKEVVLFSTNDSLEKIKNEMRIHRNVFMPIVDENRNLKDIVFWEDLFENGLDKDLFEIPVVIMAGGKGTRMKPITNIIPKPLIPLGEKTIIEHIMDKFSEYGSNKFHLSLNYKADVIKYFLKDSNPNYTINYYEESDFFGTAGSLSLLKNILNETFFVSNCDILVDTDYSELLKYHRHEKNELTIVAALKNYHIPYGTLETGEFGKLLSLEEKPNITYKINTGVYILEPGVLSEIPENEFFHITHLIQKLISQNRKVGVFPVSENSWKDYGTWKDYLLNEIK
jgi:dTDP-glucose pyrophosphorylase